MCVAIVLAAGAPYLRQVTVDALSVYILTAYLFSLLGFMLREGRTLSAVQIFDCTSRICLFV